MLLDPFTVVAQVVNFLVLLVALKYVLFDRVVDAIDAREQEIHARLDAARTQVDEAEVQAAELHRARRELDGRRERMLAEARAEVADQRAAMLAEARVDLDERRAHWERALRQERDRMLQDFDRRLADATFELVRDALARLADVDLEHIVIDTAFDRFADDGVIAREFGGSDSVEVTTSFELGDDGRHQIRERLAALGAGVDGDGVAHMSFGRDPGLVVGIRLRAAAVSVEWSARDYLERFRSIVDLGRTDDEDG